MKRVHLYPSLGHIGQSVFEALTAKLEATKMIDREKSFELLAANAPMARVFWLQKEDIPEGAAFGDAFTFHGHAVVFDTWDLNRLAYRCMVREDFDRLKAYWEQVLAHGQPPQ